MSRILYCCFTKNTFVSWKCILKLHIDIVFVCIFCCQIIRISREGATCHVIECTRAHIYSSSLMKPTVQAITRLGVSKEGLSN